MKTIFTCLFALFVGAMNAQNEGEVRLLADWVVGEYATKGQTLIAPRTSHQTMRFVEIWKDLPDLWLFMEQSDAISPDEPFRQWVFWVDQQGDNLMLEMYLLDDTLDIPGGLETTELEKYLDIDAMEVEGGCEIFLSYDGFAVFSGATVQNYCELKIRDANYITVRMNITENKIDWWEYGMKPGGEFLWGSAHDPQVFQKVK